MAEPTHPAATTDRSEAPKDRRRRTFGPVALAGLVSAGLAATAGTKPWVSGSSGSVDTDQGAEMTSMLSLDSARDAPLAGALALVVLACWGVLLVTRGRFRQAVAVVGLLAAVGTTVVTVEALRSLPGKLADALTEVSGSDVVTTSFTGWYAAALVGAGLSVVATAAAVAYVRSWPEMGAKYDSPTGAGSSDAPVDGEGAGEMPEENIDIWKALDEGRDPTA